jgi:hypothetical protein
MAAPTCADFFGIVSGALLLLIRYSIIFTYHTPLVENQAAASHRSGERSDDTHIGEERCITHCGGEFLDFIRQSAD